MSKFKNPAMKQLTEHQVRYAPRDVRLRQVERAEDLLGEMTPSREYPYAEICERITSYRPERFPDLSLPGDEAIHDLRCFVEEMSDSADLDVAEAGEPVLTVQDVSRRFRVSTKTVDRWRDRGLVSRRFRFGSRKRIGFLQSSVDRFAAQHSEEIERGRQFSQLTDAEREEIVHRARRMARYGGCPSEISRRLARRTGRSVETIRYTLRNHDRQHPEAAVFPFATAPLTDDQKRDIYQRSRRGTSASILAKKYCRTKATIYRIVAEVRARRLIDQPIDFINSEEFTRSDAAELIMADPPENSARRSAVKPPPGLPPYLASLYAIPLLSREEEACYFRRMNWFKYRADQIRDTIDPAHPRARDMNAVEGLLDSAQEIKNFLIRSNLRLVVSIAKRHIRPNTNFFEMVSDGNMSLIRAVEKFDYSRGNKFSTYASWAIMKNFARSIPAEHTVLERFRTGIDDAFQASTDDGTSEFQQQLVNRRQHSAIMTILDQLDRRERDIIVSRFGLERGVEPKTLEQVGMELGVTKERIRQLEARALKKLRRIAAEESLDIPGI